MTYSMYCIYMNQFILIDSFLFNFNYYIILNNIYKKSTTKKLKIYFIQKNESY